MLKFPESSLPLTLHSYVGQPYQVRAHLVEVKRPIVEEWWSAHILVEIEKTFKVIYGKRLLHVGHYFSYVIYALGEKYIIIVVISLIFVK